MLKHLTAGFQSLGQQNTQEVIYRFTETAYRKENTCICNMIKKTNAEQIIAHYKVLPTLNSYGQESSISCQLCSSTPLNTFKTILAYYVFIVINKKKFFWLRYRKKPGNFQKVNEEEKKRHAGIYITSI